MLSYCTCIQTHADAATELIGSMNFENFWDKIELRHCKSRTLSLCANQNARLPKALGELLQVYTTHRD